MKPAGDLGRVVKPVIERHIFFFLNLDARILVMYLTPQERWRLKRLAAERNAPPQVPPGQSPSAAAGSSVPMCS